MRLQIRWKAATRSPALEEYLERRLRFGVGRFADRVGTVRTLLEDVNGPRRGVDKRCAIELDGSLGAHRADVRGDDFYAAVDRAVGTVARRLARAADLRRPPRRRGAPAVTEPT